MNDALCVRMGNSRADFQEQDDPLSNRKLLVIAVHRDRRSIDVWHRKPWPTIFGCSRIENAFDVWMIHLSECLPF